MIKRFIECLVPDSFCNFRCSYCYVSQQNRKSKIRIESAYSPEYIAKALHPKRLGGISYINITGLGETLIQQNVVEIVHEILRTGNYVNITTNGTLSVRFLQLLDFDTELLKHLNISFSMHYIELLRLNKLEAFFENIINVRKAGCSFVLQINLVDEYMSHWEEIKKLCKEKVGAYPQVALTREQDGNSYHIMTKHSDEEYIKIGREMQSPLFDFTVHNFNKRQNKYCYAGEWSATLDLYSGKMTGCYGQGFTQNIYENIEKPIVFKPIKCCGAKYCVNSSHFMSLGVIPSLKTPTYGQLRNRKEANWYTPEMTSFLNQRLYHFNSRRNILLENLQYYQKYAIFFASSIKHKIVSKFNNSK